MVGGGERWGMGCTERESPSRVGCSLTPLPAIVDGERDPHELAAYRDPRVKATQEEIARQLHGNWHEDLLFRLRQELAAYRFWQTLMAECDKELAKLLRAFPDRSAGVALPE